MDGDAGPPVPVLLDCDAGIDDAFALALLVAHPRARLVGVTTVSGNVSAERAARNVLDLLAVAGRLDVPVAVGAREPLLRPYAGGRPEVHGPDGLGGAPVPPSDARPLTGSAVDLLLGLARRHAGRLRVLACGPLTNLAVALEVETQLPGWLDRVVAVTDLAAATAGASDANTAVDPDAARVVLDGAASGMAVPLTLVPPAAVAAEPVRERHRLRLVRDGGPLARLLGAMLVTDDGGLRERPLPDAIAAALLADGPAAWPRRVARVPPGALDRVVEAVLPL